MKNALSWIFAWLLASICTFVFASIAHSQFVLLELVNIDIAIPIGDWIGMTLSDIIGLSLGYGGVICVAMLLCFGLLSLINKRFKLPIWRYIIFAALAMAVMLLAMQPILNVTLIAGARTTMGFIAQCCAGLVGGYVFAQMRA